MIKSTKSQQFTPEARVLESILAMQEQAREVIKTKLVKLSATNGDALVSELVWGDKFVEAAALLKITQEVLGTLNPADPAETHNIDQLYEYVMQRVLFLSRNVEMSSGTMHNVMARSELAAWSQIASRIECSRELI